MNGLEFVAPQLFRLFGDSTFSNNKLCFVYLGYEYEILSISKNGLVYQGAERSVTDTVSNIARYRISRVEITSRLIAPKIKIHIAYVPR